MDRRGFFGIASLGFLAGLTATPAVAQAPPWRARAPAQTAADCPRSAPCTSPRGARYWIGENGRRRYLRRPRGPAPA